MDFGQKLKEIRKQHKFGLNQLAIKSNVSASQISRIENGKRSPKIETLQKLAKGLNIPVKEMYEMAGIADLDIENKYQEENDDSFDIAKAIQNDDYMTFGGRPLTDEEKKLLTKLLRDD